MITLNNIKKTYNKGKNNACEALKGVSLNIEDGEMIAIMGASGSGKSTLLHILSLMDDYDSGEYLLEGTGIDKMNDGKRAGLRNTSIGLVVQDFALLESESALQNVMVPLIIGRQHKPRAKALFCLEQVGIQDLAGKKVKFLSGGQKQRVAIARALANDPSFLLADEPTGALDSVTSNEIMELFHKINEKGTTVVIVTHDPVVGAGCQRIIRIADGRVQE